MSDKKIVEKNIRRAVLYLFSTLMSVVTISYLILIQGCPVWVMKLTGLVAAFQFVGLVYNIQSNSGIENKYVKIYRYIHPFSVFAAIGCLIITIFVLLAQYHHPIIPDASGEFSELDMEAVDAAENTYIFETDSMYIIFPKYTEVKHVVKDRPSPKDQDITFCCSGAFQQNRELGFRHENIDGSHAENGEYHEGYVLPDMGAFTFYEGETHFEMTDADAAIKLAAEKGGYGFQQVPVIVDGKLSEHYITTNQNRQLRCYRLLTEINGRVCIIETTEQMHLFDFFDKASKLNLENAFYMEMGSGWNHSWYRGNDGSVKYLFNIPVPFSHNWVTFCK